MTDQTAKNTVLDHTRLLALVDGDSDLLRSITRLFLNSCPVLLSDMLNAIDANDGKALKRAAHTLKGSGGHFLTDSARQILVDLEAVAEENNSKKASSLMSDLTNEMERIEPELKLIADDESTVG